MNRFPLTSTILTWSLLVTGCCATATADSRIDASAARAAGERRLNLLIITADDMNADSTGWMGNPLKPTPNLDAFAATAHRFVNAHLTVPICMPGRSALMTGLVPHRNGALGFDPVNRGTPTLVTLLQSAGYHASVIDKHTHMKGDAEFPWDLKLSGAGKNPAVMRKHVEAAIKAAKDAGKPFFLNANITDPHRPFPGAAPKVRPNANRPSDRKNKAKPVPNEGEEDNEEAADETTAKAGSGAAPPPVSYKPEQVAVPSFLEDVPNLRAEVAQYFTAMGRLDFTFKQILDVLAMAGHADDTVVVFLSDNGISMPFAKATVYRNGTWSPILIRWPQMGPSQTRQEFVSSVDLVPTVLQLLDVKPPREQDGRSLLPLLRGSVQAGRDHVVTHVNTVSSGKAFPQRCIRTAEASLIFMSWPDGKEKFRVEAMNGMAFLAMLDASRTDEKIAERVKQLLVGRTLAYYDLKSDPDERVNLIDDPKYREDVRRLGRLLLEHMKATQDPEWGGFEKTFAAWATREGPDTIDDPPRRQRRSDEGSRANLGNLSLSTRLGRASPL